MSLSSGGNVLLLGVVALAAACWHTFEVFGWHHSLNSLPIATQKVVALKTENAFYYSFYEEVVLAPSWTEALLIAVRDERSEAPSVVNALERFNIYQEVICGMLYRLLREFLGGSFLMDRWYFYRGCNYILQGFGHGCLALLASLLGGGGLRGCFLPVVAQMSYLFLHRKDISRIHDVAMLNLRENWALPTFYGQILALQTFVVTHPNFNSGTKSWRHTLSIWALRTMSLLCLLLWQFSAFVFMLQVAACFLCTLLHRSLASRRLLEELVWNHLLCTAVAVVLLCGNELLVHHMLVTECLAIWAVLRLRRQPPSRRVWFFLDGLLAVALFVAGRVLQSRWATAEEHIGEIFEAKLRKLAPNLLGADRREPSFNARLYFAVSVFDFISWNSIMQGVPTRVYHFAAAAVTSWLLSVCALMWKGSTGTKSSDKKIDGNDLKGPRKEVASDSSSSLRQRKGKTAPLSSGKSATAKNQDSKTLKETLVARVPTLNDANTYREARRLFVEELGGVDRLRCELMSTGYLSEDLQLTTGTSPMNVFARIASGNMPHPTVELEDGFLICRNRPENDEHWDSKDPEWIGKASMSKRHRFLTTKNLHLQWFNSLVFGLLEDTPGAASKADALAEVQNMKKAALKYVKTSDEGWSKDVGLYFHVFGHNSVNSLHLHIVDMQAVGPGFQKMKYKNCPIDAVIEVLREDLSREMLSGAGKSEGSAFGSCFFAVQTVSFLALGAFIERLKVLGAPLLITAAAIAFSPRPLEGLLERGKLNKWIRYAILAALVVAQLLQMNFIWGKLPFVGDRGLQTHSDMVWPDGERSELYTWITKSLPPHATVVTSMPLSAELRLNTPVRLTIHPQFEAKHLRDRVQELYEFYMCTPPERVASSMAKYNASYIVLEYKRCDFSPFLLDKHPEFNCGKGDHSWSELFCPAAHVSPHFDLLFANAGYAVFKRREKPRSNFVSADLQDLKTWEKMLNRCLKDDPDECPGRIAELAVVFGSKLRQPRVSETLFDWADLHGEHDAVVQFIIGHHWDYNLNNPATAGRYYEKAQAANPNSPLIFREYLMFLELVKKDNNKVRQLLSSRRSSSASLPSVLDLKSVTLACEAAVTAKDLLSDYQWSSQLWDFSKREAPGHRCVKTNWPLFNNHEAMEVTLGQWGLFRNIFWEHSLQAELASMAQIGVRFEKYQPSLHNFSLQASFSARRKSS